MWNSTKHHRYLTDWVRESTDVIVSFNTTGRGLQNALFKQEFPV